MRKAARLMFAVLICLFLVSLLASAQVRPAKYSNKSLNGPYSFLMNKWLNEYCCDAVALLGFMTFDGKGNLSISATLNDNGAVSTLTDSGTYSVAKNGTGSIAFSVWNDTFGIVLYAGGKGFDILKTAGGGTGAVTGTAVAMGTSSFSNASLKGSYGYLTVKTVSSQNGTAEAYAGTMTFDGVSSVSLSGTWWDAGQVESVTASGTYSVNSDGSGSTNMTDQSGNTFTLSFVINPGNKAFQYMETAGSSSDFIDAVFTGTATKQ